jgi:hypothetical protein
MKNKKTILIYDDEQQFVQKLEDKLNAVPEITKEFKVGRLTDEEFLEVVTAFKKRQEKFRENADWDGGDIALDDATIFIVDYDLLKAPKTQSLLTGEEFAYLVRCFSRCGLVIELNQFGTNVFDLRLRGYPESFADLNLGDLQIDNAYLWGRKNDDDGFRPWYWPQLPRYMDAFDQKVKDMEAGLESGEALCNILDISEEVFRLMPRPISEFLGTHEDGKDKDAGSGKVTVLEFLMESVSAFRRKDAEAVKNHRKAVEKGQHRHLGILARVAAARLSKWVECLLLPGQDILVDAPHLVSRYPSLLKAKTPSTAVLDKTAQLVDYDMLGLTVARIEKYRLKKAHWFSRPVWLWTELREDQEIPEVAEPWSTRKKLGDVVFCEDTSAFHDRSECREFYADTDSPFASRYVKICDKVDYKPRVWFSM